MFRHLGIITLEFNLKALTGLRIGGSKETFEIGGLDNPVMKLEVGIENFFGNGVSMPKGAPYVPGSSLKGKVRHLLEWSLGRVTEKVNRVLKESTKDEAASTQELKKKSPVDLAGEPCDCANCDVCKIFGTSKSQVLAQLPLERQPGPPRAIFYDLYLTLESLQRLKEAYGEGIFTEIKTENQINRLTAKANPRKVERVPAGTIFSGSIIFNLYAPGDEKLFKSLLLGLRLLEKNYLGGYGSRGSGRVKFQTLRVTWESTKAIFGEANPISFDYDDLESLITGFDRDILSKLRQDISAME